MPLAHELKPKALSHLKRKRSGDLPFNGKIYLRWHESWIMRAALAVGFVMLSAYMASILISIQTVNSISSVTYDPEVASSLGDHLKTIKDFNALNQIVYKESLLKALQTTQQSSKDTADLRSILNSVRPPAGININDSEIRGQAFAQPEGSLVVEWLSPLRLRVNTFEIVFKENALFDDFHRIEGLRQRYQFIGAALEGEIKPTLIRAHTVVLAIAFLGITLVFTVLIRRFKNAVGGVINGFMYWTEKDKGFRFGTQWRGELRLITSQFNAMADDVEENRRRSLYLEKVASWQTIARKLAHEIKNPLTPIQMMVSQLRRRYQGEDVQFQELLENAQTIISEEVAALRRMVDHFSEFARLPAPQKRFEDLKPTLQKACDLQTVAYPQHKISFETDEASLFYDFDPDLIRQVVLNLIKNAAEACGETPSEITLKLKQSVKHIDISVCDNGPGIPEDIEKNIFEAYFTTKHSGPTPGMGLGLAVCKKIIMDHDGELLLTSQPGKTVFTIRMPKMSKETHEYAN